MTLRCEVIFRFQLKLIDSLNSRFTGNPVFKEIDSIVCSGSTPGGKAKIFIDSLADCGLIVACTEGGAYIDRDMKTLRAYFFDQLTDPTKQYFTQFEKETLEGFHEDGGMRISVNDLADRLGFWDDFCFKYPDHVLFHNARDRRDSYLYYFLVGVDYTPAFDNESHHLTKEFEGAYDYYLKTFSSTPSSRVIRNYFSLIKDSEYTCNEKIDAFAGQYKQ